MRENASEIGPLSAILVTALTLLLGIGSIAAVSPPDEAESNASNWLADVQRDIASAE